MAKTEVEIKIHGSQALKQLAGVERAADRAAKAETRAKAQVEKAAKKAADTQAKEAQRAAKAAEVAAARAAKSQSKSHQEASRSAAREAEKQKREADRLADHWVRVSQRSTDHRIRQEERATKAAAREAAKRLRLEEQNAKKGERDSRGFLRKGAGLVSGAVGMIAGTGMASMSIARGVANINDPATRLQRANEFQTNLVLSANDAGMSGQETAALGERIQSVGLARGQDPLALMEGLSEAHESFNKLKFVADNLDAFAETAKATQTPFLDFVRSMLSAQNAFQLTSEQLPEAMNIMVAGAKTGALSFKAFAGPFAPAMGTFALNTGQKGIGGLRQFVAGAQTVGAGQFGAEGAETRFSQAAAFLNKAEIQKDLHGIGIDVRDETGQIDMGRVIELLATNDKFQTPEQQAAIFKDMQAREGIQTLLSQRNKRRQSFTPMNPTGDTSLVDFAGMSTVDAAVGAASVKEKTAALEATGVLDLERQAIEMQNESIRHFKELNESVERVNNVFNELEKKLGPTGALFGPALGAGLLTGALSGGLPLLGNLLRGPAAAAAPGAAAAAPGAAMSLLTSAGLTTSAGIGTVLAGAVSAGLAGYFGAKALGADDAGEAVGNWVYDLFHEDNENTKSTRTTREVPKSELKVDVEVSDNRTTVKTTTKAAKGSEVRVGQGPVMPLSMKL